MLGTHHLDLNDPGFIANPFPHLQDQQRLPALRRDVKKTFFTYDTSPPVEGPRATTLQCLLEELAAAGPSPGGLRTLPSNVHGLGAPATRALLPPRLHAAGLEWHAADARADCPTLVDMMVVRRVDCARRLSRP
jgi:hypothetical protein